MGITDSIRLSRSYRKRAGLEVPHKAKTSFGIDLQDYARYALWQPAKRMTDRQEVYMTFGRDQASEARHLRSIRACERTSLGILLRKQFWEHRPLRVKMIAFDVKAKSMVVGVFVGARRYSGDHPAVSY